MRAARREPPRIAVVGAVTDDRFGGSARPGGAVRYAARALASLGIRARVLASVSGGGRTLTPRPLPQGEREPEFEGHDLALVETGAGLAFAHETDGEGERRLRVLSTPDRALTAADWPEAWRGLDALILAPLLPGDLDAASFAALPVSRIALLAQGLQRRAASDGAVTLLDAPSDALGAALDERTSVFLSGAEVASWPRGTIDGLAASCARVVVTRGADGADVHRTGEATLHVAAAPATPVDTTGAGDAFAAAFTAALACGAGDAEAGALAARVAAAAVGVVGPERLPPIAVAEERAAAR